MEATAIPTRRTSATTEETVLSVTHHGDGLFSFSITRPAGFRFASGEFVMLGLETETGPLLRAYSIASPSWAETLDFHSIKVPDGPLTGRLRDIVPGDRVLLGRKPTGTLVAHALTPAERLWLFSTGTGVAPYASLLREPDLWERFGRVILVHGCRRVADLAYARALVEALPDDPLVGDVAPPRLRFVPSVTREDFSLRGRIPELIGSGRLWAATGEAPLDPATDRAMICGSAGLLATMRGLLDGAGFREGTASAPGDYAIERAFVG
jgi:ferredoxin--NADP+ reductase